MSWNSCRSNQLTRIRIEFLPSVVLRYSNFKSSESLEIFAGKSPEIKMSIHFSFLNLFTSIQFNSIPPDELHSFIIMDTDKIMPTTAAHPQKIILPKSSKEELQYVPKYINAEDAATIGAGASIRSNFSHTATVGDKKGSLHSESFCIVAVAVNRSREVGTYSCFIARMSELNV